MAEIMKFILDHGSEIGAAIAALVSGIIAICMLIPGDQPEKFLQSIVDFLAKFSKKPENK